ncbi:MAG: PAS domain-containing sensor histidine kinase [Flavobacterium sp.]|nr:MAG: PAS domain-containing sensor histidine kinase [Flavobacterium sp.]
MTHEFCSENPLLAATLSAVRSAVCLVDEAGTFAFVNPAYADLFGYRPEEMIGTSFLEIVPDNEKENAINITNAFFTSGKTLSGEWKRQKRDGSLLEVQSHAQMITASDGRRFIVVTVEDVSRRKKIERQLNSSEKRYRSALEHVATKTEELRRLIMNAALDAIICIDANDTVSLWNPQAEKIFGWTKEEVVGQRLSDYIIPDPYKEMHRNGIKRYMETGQGRAINTLLELTAVNREGHHFPIELTVLPIRQEGEDEIFCAFIRDITDRKRNEETLRDLNERMSKTIEDLAKSNIELEQFAYIASHDLQEPLRMVTSFLSQLEKKYDGKLDEKGKQYLNFAVDGAVRMRKVILDLLEYSRAGKADITTEQVDLNQLASEVLKLNTAAIQEKNVSITVEQLPVVSFSRISMQQIFQNLIGNAIKYQGSNERPEVKIGCREVDGFWEISVADNGIGMEAQFFDKIFVLFQRLHNRDEYSGTGIGLSICKKIIEGSGGRIWVESETGAGSTFYFTIKK